MRAFLTIAWLLLSALVVWYMLNYTTHAPQSAVANAMNDGITVVDEVKGSIYTQPSSDEQKNNEQAKVETQDESVNSDEGNNADFRKEGKERADFTEKTYIEFNQNSMTLPKSPTFSAYLDSVAMLVNAKGYAVELIGHTDSKTSRKYNNYQVGLKRANHIRDLLLSRGVDQSKISVDSKGDKEPRIEGDSPAAQTKNRRVELFLKPN